MFVSAENTSQPVTTSTRPFLISPRNDKFVHGETTQLPGGRHWDAILIVIVLVIFLIAFGWYSITELQKLQSLDQRGVIAHGTIINTSYTTSSKGSRSYYVTYSFSARTPNGEPTTYTKEQLVNYSTYANPPDPVQIKYLPSDPTVSMMLGDNEDRDSTEIGFVLFIIGIIATIVVIFYTVKAITYDHRLAHDGKLIPAELIVGTGRWVSGKHRHYNFSAQYQFTTPEGKVIHKTQTAIRSDLQNAVLPEPGTLMMVLYLDDKHYRLM